MKLQSPFLSLPAALRALVATAVLFDGNDAANYLELDAKNGAELKAAAKELASIELELRVPYAGTQLRLALQDIE